MEGGGGGRLTPPSTQGNAKKKKNSLNWVKLCCAAVKQQTTQTNTRWSLVVLSDIILKNYFGNVPCGMNFYRSGGLQFFGLTIFHCFLSQARYDIYRINRKVLT